MELENLTIKKAREMLDKKEISAVELAKLYTDSAENKNSELNAYLEIYGDVSDQAKLAQEKIDAGEPGSLTGIPIAIKDNILVKGRVASSASKILEKYKATYDSTVVKKLIEQGAVLVGRTNMDEFAMGGSTENSAFGVVKNPQDTERVAGGSSGGSAAVVAANMALGALGSDTGGSVREPASFCGVVGLKPTYGAVSRYGLMAMGSSLDIIGPMAKTVEDAEIIFNAIKGRDMMDATSIDEKIIAPKKIGNNLPDSTAGIKIGVPRHILEQEGISKEVKENFDESLKKLESLGFKIADIKLPNIDKSLAVYYIIMPAEVSSNMSRFDGIKFGLSVEAKDLLEVYKKSRGLGFGPEVRRRIILGTYVLSHGYYDAYYGRAMVARKIIREEFDKAFHDVDAILTPTAPSIAWKIGEKTTPIENYLADIFTVSANITGVPAISLPSGFSEISGKKLPLGIQFMAPHMGEITLFEIGKKFLGENK